MRKIRKAVFPVAGYGTRMLPATKAIPKEMITLVDKPLIQYAVEEAVNSGIEQIIFVSGRSKKPLEDHFDYNTELNQILKNSGKDKIYEDMKRISEMADVVYVRQKQMLGLGHAILCAKDIVGDEPFAVFLPDDILFAKEKPVMAQLIEQYEKVGSSVVSLMRVPTAQTSKYGIVVVGSSADSRFHKLVDMVEKPKENPPSNLAIVGRYVLSPDVMENLKSTKPDKGGEIQLTSALQKAAQSNSVYGYEFEGRRFDCGDKIGLLEATMHFAATNPELAGEYKRIVQEVNKEFGV
ncbi:UTP--glucose-1-phosphate uridylyltransferase GalU [Deferribacterales bacterium RsTz2092]|nr:UTP--glucose-1-phosphate uridylyltransferase [Deferribacterales bacterium]